MGGNPARYILAEDIPRLENLSLYEQSMSRVRPGSWFHRVLRTMLGLFAVLAVGGGVVVGAIYLGLFDSDPDGLPPPEAGQVAAPPPTLTATPTPTPSPARTPAPLEQEIEHLRGGSSSAHTPTPTPAPMPVPTATATPLPTATPKPTSTAKPKRWSDAWIKELEQRIHFLVNAQRPNPLGFDKALAAIARTHSADMARYNYFSHDNLRGQSPTDRGAAVGYDCLKDYGPHYTYGLAENIFYASLYEQYWTVNGVIVRKDWYEIQELAEVVVDGWMDSPGHRENILEDGYGLQGIGVAISSD